MAKSPRKRDQEKVDSYLRRLELARTTTVDAFETLTDKMNAIQRSKWDIEFMVNRYFKHYATAECAEFQKDFAELVADNPLIKAFAEWGRGLAKSVWCNVIIPFWLWLRGEDVFMCVMSDSKERAEDLIADIQAEFEGNEVIINDFGAQRCEGSWEYGSFRTIDQRFIGMAFGIKKKVRGIRVGHRRPNLWVVDDLETPDTIGNPKRMRKQKEIIERDVIPTMTDKHCRRLLYANNRFARVMTQTMLQESHPHPKWYVHQIKAYNKVTYESAWPAMYDKEYYQLQEEDMGIPAAYAEYNHETKLEGKNFSEDDIQWAELPDWFDFKMIIVHWDIAYTDNDTSDYNAVKAWGVCKNNKFWKIDCFVKQAKMNLPCDWMCEFKKSLPQGVNVLFQYESQFWNEEVQRNIDEAEDRNDVSLNMMKVSTPKVNKLGRMLTMVPYYKNGRIYYNIKLKSHNDTQVAIMQLCAVEEGSTEHDDSPDADREALSALEKYVAPAKKRKEGEKSYRTGKMKRKDYTL